MREYKRKLKREGIIPKTRGPYKKKELSPGSQRLHDYWSLVKPYKTKKQIKEERNLQDKLGREEYLRNQEEAANAAASNTEASYVDSTQTTAGSSIATLNADKEKMAIDDTGDVDVVDYSTQIFDNDPAIGLNDFSDAIPWEEPNPDAVVPVHLISYVHGQEEQEWEEQVKKDSEKRKKQKEQLSQARKQSAASHLAWWDKLEPQVYKAYETYVSQSEEGSSKPPPGCFLFEFECECSPQL